MSNGHSSVKKKYEKTLSKDLLDHAKSFTGHGYKGPLMTIDMVSSEDMHVINKHVWSLFRKSPGVDIMDLYLVAFNNLGIMCPHPQMYRLYSGKRYYYPVATAKWFFCEVCECNVINEMSVNAKKEE